MPFFKEYLGYRAERNQPPANRTELLTKFKAIDNPKHRALFVLDYLLGCRIEELLGIPQRDYLPVMKYQLEQKKSSLGEDILVVNNVRILKLKTPEFRNVPIPLNKESEFLALIEPYLSIVPMEEPLFNYHRGYVWQLAKKYFGKEYFPHWFRHTRASHLVQYYGFTSNELAQFFGWKNINRTLTYVHLDWQNLANKMNQLTA